MIQIQAPPLSLFRKPSSNMYKFILATEAQTGPWTQAEGFSTGSSGSCSCGVQITTAEGKAVSTRGKRYQGPGGNCGSNVTKKE